MEAFMNKAIQEYYPDKVNHCFGCGKLNDHGLQIRSYWDGNECICTFMPEKYHKAFEGFVYGGLIDPQTCKRRIFWKYICYKSNR